jgi:GMP synthase (glutamine-hydrolysing)
MRTGDSDRPQVALLNAAHKAESTGRNFRRELAADIAEFHCPEGEVPPDFRYDAVVITGSSASVYWDREWIGRLKRWVGDAVEAGLPALGVCYGHQLLADVMGGQVEAMDEYEIGYRTIERTAESRLLDGLGTAFTAFTTHSDRVSVAPPGATVIAENDYGIHGFRKADVFTVQFHPEYDLETARTVTKDKDELAAERRQRVLAGITEDNYRAARAATGLFDNFIEYVRET